MKPISNGLKHNIDIFRRQIVVMTPSVKVIQFIRLLYYVFTLQICNS